MPWDAEIWAPCRLGESFYLWDLGFVKKQYLYAIKADWNGQHGDVNCVSLPTDLENPYPYHVKVGAGPRPWACCWTYAPKICITPPVWCWDFQDDTQFGLDLPLRKDGTRRQVKLSEVLMHRGKPAYRIVVKKSGGNELLYLDSLPVLEPYFAPIWPTPMGRETVVPQGEHIQIGVIFTPISGDDRPNWLQARSNPETVRYIYTSCKAKKPEENRREPEALKSGKIVRPEKAGNECLRELDIEEKPPPDLYQKQPSLMKYFYYYYWQPPEEGENHGKTER